MLMFSVVTPSFQQSNWLNLAIKSVEDQELPVEHIIQDSCSTDGTREMLLQHPSVHAILEKDTGMYDAVNRGLRRATGQIISYLNCDEQYLPGTLSRVGGFFENNPEIDFLFGGLVVVDSEGKYVCSRKMLPPMAAHTRVCHLSTFTCSTFFRRRILDDHELFFNSEWKAVGDAEWMLRCLQKGLKMASIPDLISAFVDTGSNLGASATSEMERNRLRDSAPVWQRATVPLVALHHRLRRWQRGIYDQKPFDYAIYTQSSPAQRVSFQVAEPTTLWKKRFTILR